MSWRELATEVIRKVDAALPVDATYDQARRALIEAYPFGQRESWPYKAWLREQNIYLRKRYPEAFVERDRRRRRAARDESQGYLFEDTDAFSVSDLQKVEG